MPAMNFASQRGWRCGGLIPTPSIMPRAQRDRWRMK